MNTILLEMIKSLNGDYEKTFIYENGDVDIEISHNGIVTHTKEKFDFASELKEQLLKCYDLLIDTYDHEQNEDYQVIFQNHVFNSFFLYSDIHLKLLENQMSNLAVLEEAKYKEGQEKQDEFERMVLENYQNRQPYMKIDIQDCEDVQHLEDERAIISFALKENSDFTLGQSRIFSDTIDLASDVELPQDLEFVAQLNLSEISSYDQAHLLPKTGMLYFFQSHDNESGQVIYSSGLDLSRKTISGDIVLNISLQNIENKTEKFSDRYNEEGEYDSFKNEELNKIYGFYTDCQMDEEDIKKVSQKYLVLLQLGSELYGEGVTTYLITEENLKNKNFDQVVYTYVQS